MTYETQSISQKLADQTNFGIKIWLSFLFILNVKKVTVALLLYRLALTLKT